MYVQIRCVEAEQTANPTVKTIRASFHSTFPPAEVSICSNTDLEYDMNILNTFRILRSFCNTNQQESHGTATAVIPRVDAVHKYLHRFIHQEITSSNASVHLININDSEVFAVLLPSISEPYRTNHEFPSFHRVYKITH